MKRNLFSGDVAITAGTGFNGIVGKKGLTYVHIVRIKLFDFVSIGSDYRKRYIRSRIRGALHSTTPDNCRLSYISSPLQRLLLQIVY
jgi:hypothetical protein